MEKSQVKKILKVAVVLYIASFLIINWTDVSWVFNYRVVSGLVSDFFNPYPSIDASELKGYFYPNHSSEQGNSQNSGIINPKITYTDKHNTIEIPKIGITAPIIFSESANREELMEDLNLGVVYYPGSVYPGQVGQIVILGHSAPVGWPKVRHDWVFTDLDKLTSGDEILIDLNNKQYSFIVVKKMIIAKGADDPQEGSFSGGNTLTLISCWPPGKDYQRIAIKAVLLEEPK